MRKYTYSTLAAAIITSLATQASAAVYELQEIPSTMVAERSYAAAINNSGDVVITGELPFNPAIDISILNFDTDTLADTLTDIESARNGNFNAEDLEFVEALIKSQEASSLTQRIANIQSYVVQNDSAELIPGFDEIDGNLGTYSGSTETQVREITDSGIIVGFSEGRYKPVEYVNTNGDTITYYLQDFGRQGFVDLNGTIVNMESDVDATGGYSEAFDINNNLLVAGFEATDPSDSRISTVEACADADVRGDFPEELCLQSQIQLDPFLNYQAQATLWQLDEAGNITEKRNLGFLVTRDDDETRLFVSRAWAVNDNGIAVGDATDFYQDDENQARTFAAIYDGDQVTGFTDHEEFFNSVATDVNNNNIAVGQASKSINGFTRTKFFVHNIDDNTTTYPDDFFDGSGSVARAINENNMVVGEGDVDSQLTSFRRTHGFLYSIDDDTFQDLNDLLPCNTPYTIVQANDINDDNEIVATALIRRETLNRKGETIVDDNGDPVIDDVITSVLLTPVPGGEIESCEVPEGEAEAQERSGGSTTFYSLSFLFVLAFLRRFRN